MSVGSVLDDNMAAARLLAKVAHEEVLVDAGPELDDVDVDLDLEDLGVWIDPIGNTCTTAVILRGLDDRGLFQNTLYTILL